MASPTCQNHPEVPAVFIGTFMTDGTPVACCDECLVQFAAGILQAMTGVDPAPFMAAISEDAAPQAAEPSPSGNGATPTEAGDAGGAAPAEAPDESRPPGEAGLAEATAVGDDTPAAGESGTPDAS